MLCFDAGRFDVPIPPLQPRKQSDHVASMLYIADFLTQFTQVLAIKPITFRELSACLHPNTLPNALLDPPAVAATHGTAVAAVKGTHGPPAKAVAANGIAGAGPTSNGPRAVANGLGSNSDASTGSIPAGHEGLFELYRGLLQFLLQVNECPVLSVTAPCSGICLLTHHCICASTPANTRLLDDSKAPLYGHRCRCTDTVAEVSVILEQ